MRGGGCGECAEGGRGVRGGRTGGVDTAAMACGGQRIRYLDTKAGWQFLTVNFGLFCVRSTISLQNQQNRKLRSETVRLHAWPRQKSKH
jgi:hypothetical protein